MSGVPTTIGRYEVERILGEGGMGVLYLARDPVLERHVALKLLRVDGDLLRRRLMREAQSAARLQHPNIVTVYDVGDHDGQLYIAMEYIDGDTLGALIRDDVPFSPIRKLDIIDEVADGLGFAHQRGIIHRDIKPANLMMSRCDTRAMPKSSTLTRPERDIIRLAGLMSLWMMPRWCAKPSPSATSSMMSSLRMGENGTSSRIRAPSVSPSMYSMAM